MNSFWKGVAHTIIPLASVAVLTFISKNGWADLTVGGLVGIGFNWLLSHTVPTTTGASAE